MYRLSETNFNTWKDVRNKIVYPIVTATLLGLATCAVQMDARVDTLETSDQVKLTQIIEIHRMLIEIQKDVKALRLRDVPITEARVKLNEDVEGRLLIIEDHVKRTNCFLSGDRSSPACKNVDMNPKR